MLAGGLMMMYSLYATFIEDKRLREKIETLRRIEEGEKTGSVVNEIIREKHSKKKDS